MSRKSPNLTLSLPQCRNCDRHWRPPEGVVASQSYCPKCASERRKKAAARFDLKPVRAGGIGGAFHLPRALRDL
ncbi:MAG: hypothetical protein QOH81_1109 [Sphingomonadales bacterium]|jgi:predicted Zn-ribbon and HTH transcriptional regulator|nr:hypothetical protein [Sphingomonadales bacterium]